MTKPSVSLALMRGGAAVAGFGLLVNWPWEFLQVPLYAGWSDSAHWESTLICTRATFGDAFIMLVAFAVISAFSGGSQWITDGRMAPRVAWVVVAFLLSMAFEGASIYLLGRWDYSSSMPQFLGLGLSPVVQWIVLPPLTLWLARRHLLGSRMIQG